MVSMMLLCLKTICTFKSVVNTFVHDRIRFVFGLVVTVVFLSYSTSCHESYISWISIERAIERTLNESQRYWLWSIAGVLLKDSHRNIFSKGENKTPFTQKKVVRFTYFLGLTAGRVAREVFFAIPRADPQAGKMTSGGETNRGTAQGWWAGAEGFQYFTQGNTEGASQGRVGHLWDVGPFWDERARSRCS